MMRAWFIAVVRRELRAAFARRGALLQPPAFFLVVVALFPLAAGGALPAQSGGGVIWVTLLLAALLSMRRIFADDADDGSLVQMLLAARPLAVLVLGKVCAHWLSTCLPLILLAPLIGVMWQLPAGAQAHLLIGLLLGTPALSMFGAFGAALTAGLKHGGVLLPLLILPLFVPALIFGAGAVNAATQGAPANADLLLLAAYSFAALSLMPMFTALALRIGAAE